MLTDLFPQAHGRYDGSPVAPWLHKFAEWLTNRGYSRKATQWHVRRLRQALERAGGFPPHRKLTGRQLDELFMFPTCSAQYRATGHNFQRFLISTGQGCLLSEPEFGRFTDILVAYREYLLDLRGFAVGTIRHHLATAYAFLIQAVKPDSPVSTISALAVESFVTAAGQRLKRTTLQQPVGQLRCFLRFCFERGDIPVRLDGIDSPKVYKGELPPKALPWKLTLKFLASIDQTEAGGCRDHAVLYLMAYLGLRPSEVALLNLDSINWTSGTLEVVQPKTRSRLVLPLPASALMLLRRYIFDARPDSRLSSLFLRLRAPAQALTSTTIRAIYRRRARQSGLPLEGTSSYSLRHGFAMHLMDHGVRIKAIGDLLGHRTVESTSVYLRLQIESLREVGLSLPRLAEAEGGQHETL